MIHYSGAYGVTFTDGAVSGYGTPARTAYKSYIYVDPNYDGFGYTDRTLPMKVTAAHEYFHAIQFAYNVNAGDWFMEISSTWMEDIVYDTINDYRYYLSGFFNYPYYGLDKFNGLHEYASCIFGHYVSENYGNNRMKRIWDLTVNAGSNAAMNGVNTALVEVGTTRSDAFAGFSVWNYLTGSRANGSHPTYSEASYFPQISIAGSYTTYPVSATSASNLEHLAAHYYQFSPVVAPSNLRLGFSQISSSQWKGKVVVDSSSQFKSYDVNLSTGTGRADILRFNNKTKAIFIPSNVATTGSSLTYNYTGDVLLPQDFVALQSPIGKENWEADSTYQIKWISYGTSGNVKIELSRDAGLTYEIISSSTPDDGLESWIATGPLSAEAQIKITDAVNPLITFSSNDFLIGNKDTVTYQSGWNLISVATRTMNLLKNYIYPNATSNIFLYDYGYSSVDTLKNGVGYWTKFASDSLNVIVGIPLITDTVDVKPGWNLIGGLSTPINLQQITSEPVNIIASEYYGYDGGYKTATTLEPWKAYWVKVNKAGKLIMTSTMK
jgi:hypothetical protein